MTIPIAFFADENVPPELVNWIRQSGYPITSIQERNLNGVSDREIIEMAFAGSKTIVTQDSDFGKLIYTSDIPFYMIIYIRPGHFNGNFHFPTIQKVIGHSDLFKPSTLIIAHRKDDKVTIRIKHF